MSIAAGRAVPVLISMIVAGFLALLFTGEMRPGAAEMAADQNITPEFSAAEEAFGSSGLLTITTLSGGNEGHLITFPDSSTLSIDCAIGDITTLSHYHDDHCATCSNPGNFQYNRHNVTPGQVIYEKDGVTVTVVAANGRVIGEGAVDMPCNADNENEWSMALWIKYRGFDYLTAGDMYGSVEVPLGETLKNRGVKVDVFKVSHHGTDSHNTSSLEFFQDISPEYATICGTATHPCAGDGSTIPNLIAAGARRIYCIPNYGLSGCLNPVPSQVRNGTGTLTISTDGSTYYISTPNFSDFYKVDEYATSDDPHLMITEAAIDSSFLSPENHRWIELYLPPGASSVDLSGLYWVSSDKKGQLAKDGSLMMYPGDVAIIHKTDFSTDTAYIDESSKTGKGSNGWWDVYTKLDGDYWYSLDDCLIISKEDSLTPAALNIYDAVVWSNLDGYMSSNVIAKGNDLIGWFHWGNPVSGSGGFGKFNDGAAVGDIRAGYIQRIAPTDADSKTDWKISPTHSYGTPPPTPAPPPPPPPPPPSFEINVNSNSLSAGERFTVSAVAQSLTNRTFDGYAVIIAPTGKIYSIQRGNRLVPGVVPLVRGVRALPRGYAGRLLDMELPSGIKGDYRVIGGLVDAGGSVRGSGSAFWRDMEYVSVR